MILHMINDKVLNRGRMLAHCGHMPRAAWTLAKTPGLPLWSAPGHPVWLIEGASYTEFCEYSAADGRVTNRSVVSMDWPAAGARFSWDELPPKQTAYPLEAAKIVVELVTLAAVAPQYLDLLDSAPWVQAWAFSDEANGWRERMFNDWRLVRDIRKDAGL